MEYPQTRAACAELASDLIGYLKEHLGSTSERTEWTQRNFRLLNEFATARGLDTFHKRHTAGSSEFLWDWTAYAANAGLVIACESEWDSEKENHRRHLEHDFEKLLSASCPIKLFMCWSERTEADKIKNELQRYAAEQFGVFQRGSVVILYCIDPHTKAEANDDHVWQFQADGEFSMSPERLDLKPVV